jgi:hypothetical protein
VGQSVDLYGDNDSILQINGTTTINRGNFGIGTTTPSEALSVVGNIFSTGYANLSGPIYVGDGTASDQSLLVVNVDPVKYSSGQPNWYWSEDFGGSGAGGFAFDVPANTGYLGVMGNHDSGLFAIGDDVDGKSELVLVVGDADSYDNSAAWISTAWGASSGNILYQAYKPSGGSGLLTQSVATSGARTFYTNDGNNEYEAFSFDLDSVHIVNDVTMDNDLLVIGNSTTTGKLSGGWGSQFGTSTQYWKIEELDLTGSAIGDLGKYAMLAGYSDGTFSNVGAINDALVLYDGSDDDEIPLTFVANDSSYIGRIYYNGTAFIFDDVVTSSANLTVTGNLQVNGKITATGGVDPPYVSYTNESCDTIKQMYQDDEVKDNVMQFWNIDNRRFEYYLADKDVCYPLSQEGAPLESLPAEILDPSIASSTINLSGGFWQMDGETGYIKPITSLDLLDSDLLNVRSITSASGNWSIGEDGQIVVKSLRAESAEIEDLTIGTGVTIKDSDTGEYQCLYVASGSVETKAGPCQEAVDTSTSSDQSSTRGEGSRQEGDTSTTTPEVTDPDPADPDPVEATSTDLVLPDPVVPDEPESDPVIPEEPEPVAPSDPDPAPVPDSEMSE